MISDKIWIEVAVQVGSAATDIVAAILMAAGAGGVVIEDPRLMASKRSALGPDLIDEPSVGVAAQRPTVEEGNADNDAQVVIKAYLLPNQAQFQHLEAISARIAQWGGRLSTQMVQEEDWAHVWKKHYKPMRIGRHLLVVPSWEQIAPQPDDVVITLDPGMAFGTGIHPSTQLCLMALEDTITPGCSVLDIGTGSGILAIAAAKLGAKRVIALDIDENVVTVAASNVAINNVDHIVQTETGSLGSFPTLPADVLVANIVADTIIHLLPLVAGSLTSNGVFVAAGIVEQRLPDVLAAWQKAGLLVQQIRRQGEWVCIMGG